VGRLERHRAPPPHYYAEKLSAMLAGVEKQYSDLLTDEERRFIRDFSALSAAAQRLFARLVSRKGPLLRVESLRYAEIECTATALHELVAAGFVERAPERPADLWLDMLTIAELTRLFPRIRRLPKRRLVDAIAASRPDAEIRRQVDQRHAVIALRAPDVLERLKFLFFGESADLATFVLEDLGVWRFEEYRLDPRQRRFRDRAAFQRFLDFVAMGEQLAHIESVWDLTQARALLHALREGDPSRFLERRRGRLLMRLARAAERAGALITALDAYRASTAPSARERWVRVLGRLGRSAEQSAALAAMRDAPRSAAEVVFAAAFGGQRLRRPRRVPETRLRLPRPPAGGVERAVMSAWLANGGIGRHLENVLPLSLLGLAFWDVIFAPVEGAFVNPYQDRPVDLYWPDFRAARASALAMRLDELRCPVAFRARVLGHHREKHGLRCALVTWDALDRTFLEALLHSIPCGVFCQIFDHLLDDLQASRTGFPDLTLLYGRSRYEFIEVKGPGDQLSRDQRLWFDFFARTGLPARVVRVAW
jgi:hypothetical protein